MIDKENAPENRQSDEVVMSDGETFKAAFDKGEPAKPEEKPDPEFDKQMESRVQPVAKQETFKEAFARNMKNPDVVKAGKFQWTNPATGKTTWYKAAYESKAKPAKIQSSTAPASFESVKGEQASQPATKSSIYADNFIKDGINKIKGKLSDKGSESKTLPSGKPNLTAAV